MKRKLMGLGMALFGLLSIAHSQSLVTNVMVQSIWTDTGLYLTNGEWASVNASGFWNWRVNTDPDGLIDFVPGAQWAPNIIEGSLIAFVGSDPYAGSQWETNGTFQTNQYLELGTAGQFMSATNGELWLGVNDYAFTGSPGSAHGSNDVAVSLGFSHCDCYSNLSLSVAYVSSNSFAFYISNGIPNTVCGIYDSADLTHWTLIDSIVLGTGGSSRNGRDVLPPSSSSGLTNGAYYNNTAVPYRFYKVSNGQFWSQAIGFERITAQGGGTNGLGYSLIADQLIAPDNTLNGLFDPMPDHSTLPDSSQILIWDQGIDNYDYYTNSGGAWSPNGSVMLSPGEGFFLALSNTTIVTFAGLVPQGDLTNVLDDGFTIVGSQVPQAGGVGLKLGLIPQYQTVNPSIQFWNGNGWGPVFFYYDAADAAPYPAGWYDASGNWNPVIINVGQAFLYDNGETNTEYWVRKFPGCCDP